MSSTASCGSYAPEPEVISKMGWGGPRENAGGARPGAGRPRKIPSGIARNDDPGWYVVRAISEEEHRAEVEIRRAAFEVFRPLVYQRGVTARRRPDGSLRPSRPDRLRSMFPGYFFTRFRLADPAWPAIRSLPGVEAILGRVGAPERPFAVADETIALLRAMLDPNDCLYPKDHFRMNPIDPGQSLRVLTGSMEGHEGICQWSDSRRVRLFMTILGRQVPVTVARSGVEVL
jgi:transcription antitermination factor NusG